MRICTPKSRASHYNSPQTLHTHRIMRKPDKNTRRPTKLNARTLVVLHLGLHLSLSPDSPQRNRKSSGYARRGPNVLTPQAQSHWRFRWSRGSCACKFGIPDKACEALKIKYELRSEGHDAALGMTHEEMLAYLTKLRTSKLKHVGNIENLCKVFNFYNATKWEGFTPQPKPRSIETQTSVFILLCICMSKLMSSSALEHWQS